MRRGTTPRNTFSLPFSTDIIERVKIIYAQNNQILMVKTNVDCSFGDKVITVQLTQTDTLKFDHQSMVEIQVRILTVDGNALASNIILTRADELLENEPI